MIEQRNLIEQLGDPYTNKVVDRLHRFAFMPPPNVDRLAKSALSEHWGAKHYVLSKYLAVHVPWAIEQGHFTASDSQFFVTAGHLQTRYGTPLYLVFEPNKNLGQEPWCLVRVGSEISAPQLPSPPAIPTPPPIPVGAEIVMMHDHILGEHSGRVPFLKDTPPVAQMCAISGAIQWSINRGLQLPYWYFGRMNYLVPLYLQNRENITLAPDLIAPVQVNPQSLLVRTVLAPSMPYANARVAVRRHDQLPPWLLSTWAQHAATATEAQIEDPESR
jgi:hypothetical protein